MQEESGMDRPKTPYSQVCEDELILRDHLAAERTVLANERTALAYLRTMLTFLIGGATFIQFFDSLAIKLLGWVFIPTALVLGVYGMVKYAQVKRLLAQIGSAAREGSAPAQGGE
jgi:putative membrane protein